jgi:hypothetical protein
MKITKILLFSVLIAYTFQNPGLLNIKGLLKEEVAQIHEFQECPIYEGQLTIINLAKAGEFEFVSDKNNYKTGEVEKKATKMLGVLDIKRNHAELYVYFKDMTNPYKFDFLYPKAEYQQKQKTAYTRIREWQANVEPAVGFNLIELEDGPTLWVLIERVLELIKKDGPLSVYNDIAGQHCGSFIWKMLEPFVKADQINKKFGLPLICWFLKSLKFI